MTGVLHGESSGVRSVHSLSKFDTQVSPVTSGMYGEGTWQSITRLMSDEGADEVKIASWTSSFNMVLCVWI